MGPAAPWSGWAFRGAWGSAPIPGPGTGAGRGRGLLFPVLPQSRGAADLAKGRFKAAGWDTRLSPGRFGEAVEAQRGGSEGPPTRPSAKLRSPGAWRISESSWDSGRVASQTRCRLQPELTRVPRAHPQCGEERLVFSPQPSRAVAVPSRPLGFPLAGNFLRDLSVCDAPDGLDQTCCSILVLCQGPYLSVLSAPPAGCWVQC